MINIYCDESCHLPHDNSTVMVIGGISCPKDKVSYINSRIRQIKKKHGVYEFAEIKWTKVSNSKLQMYKELIDLFFEHSYLEFRAVIATNKDKLSCEKFNLTYDDWYQRIYYYVLKEMVNEENQSSIYVDIKDTKGIEKVNKLKSVLNKTFYDFNDNTVTKIQLVVSHQIQIMQITDLLIGSVCYANRNLNTSDAKCELINYIQQKAGRNLVFSTPKSEEKFNLFLWTPKEI